MYLSSSTYRYRYILRKTLFLWREQIQEFYRSVQQKQVLGSLTFLLALKAWIRTGHCGFHEAPERAGGGGGCTPSSSRSSVTSGPTRRPFMRKWIAIRTYGYVPPRSPVPMTRRRTLRHNAIEAWQTMQETGWRRCPPLVR